jgi:hypothetical protein
VHDAPVTGRFLAVCGLLAWHVRRAFGPLGRGARGNVPVQVLAAALLILALIPIVLPLVDPQPEDIVAQQLFDGTVTEPQGWVRLTGQLVPLRRSPTGERGAYGLLVDDDNNRLRAVVVQTDARPQAEALTMLTGHVAPAFVVFDEELPIEATVAGTPPQVVSNVLVELDPVAKPPRTIWWPLAIPPLVLALMLLIGARSGYPIFRTTTEVDVLANPLSPGERVPSAYGGRIGPNERSLADPGNALLLVRGGPTGSLLTAQPLPDDGQLAPPPVLIGGSWTSGKVGVVHTATETVPALLVRSELVDATFLFARRTERDRVAALVAVER